MSSDDLELAVRLLLTLATGGMTAGCRSVPVFRERPVCVHAVGGADRTISFDMDKDGYADYLQRFDAKGRKVELRFGPQPGVSDYTILLDELASQDVPHFIVALDGVPYQLVKQLYDEGCFRLFYPSAQVVSCFPGMTDPAFQRIFGGQKPVAYESKYFDRNTNRLAGGSSAYLADELSDWAKRLDYYCSSSLGAFAYIKPKTVLNHELNKITDLFRKTASGTRVVYSVATAGLGTRGGREAILDYLRTMDKWCELIVYEHRGNVKISLLADHGHSTSGQGRLSFRRLLKENGYRPTSSLKKPKDVVIVEFGLVTYAALYTSDPPGVASAVLKDPRTTIACYPATKPKTSGADVVVQTADGLAIVRERHGRFCYDAEHGDPLELSDIVRQLRLKGSVDSDGFADDRAVFEATLNHRYPDPLRRIWFAFNGLVQQPPDLIVCLQDGWVHGSGLFHKVIGKVASTHGSLNQSNSMTFVMTMLGELPPALRLEEVMPSLEKLYWN